MLQVYTIFKSIQGESSRAGLPCSFVRLAGCPLRCVYCDTPLVRAAAGQAMSVDEILARVAVLRSRLVEVTGGEPLAQPETGGLLTALCDAGYEVLLETSGAFPTSGIDPRVRVIMDVKTPGSGMSEKMLAENFVRLVPGRNELKFAVTSRDDFDWAVDFCRDNGLEDKATLLVSPVHDKVSPAQLAEWVLGCSVSLRLQLQLHKIIWPHGEDER